MTSQTLKEKILSRQFGAAIAFFCVTTSLLIYLVIFKCDGETFNHESALKYIDTWSEYNLWNALVFITGDTGKKIVNLMSLKQKPQ